MKAWALVTCTVVNGYLLGVMVLFAAVEYPGFGTVDRSAFAQLYSGFTGRIGGPVVLLEFAALLATLALYVARPESSPLGAVHALLILGVAYFVITFAWHLPSHRALASGENGPAALAPLLQSQWARTGVQVGRVAVMMALCARAMGG